MRKTFYTERDIADLYAAGTTQLRVDESVILTDLAREKAEALGMHLTTAASQPDAPAPFSPLAAPTGPSIDLVAQVKARVIARLGTNQYNDVLDEVIPQVLARLAGKQSLSPQTSGATIPNDDSY